MQVNTSLYFGSLQMRRRTHSERTQLETQNPPLLATEMLLEQWLKAEAAHVNRLTEGHDLFVRAEVHPRKTDKAPEVTLQFFEKKPVSSHDDDGFQQVEPQDTEHQKAFQEQNRMAFWEDIALKHILMPYGLFSDWNRIVFRLFFPPQAISLADGGGSAR